MIKVTAKTDFRRAISKLRNMNRQVRRTCGEVLESEGRIVAIAPAKSTQPFGTGRDAQDMGHDMLHLARMLCARHHEHRAVLARLGICRLHLQIKMLLPAEGKFPLQNVWRIF